MELFTKTLLLLALLSLTCAQGGDIETAPGTHQMVGAPT